jgi:hypothetical protein
VSMTLYIQVRHRNGRLLELFFLRNRRYGGHAATCVVMSAPWRLVTMDQWTGARRAFDIKVFHKNDNL